MFGMDVRMAIGRLLNDDQVSEALREGGNDMQNGIMSRCVDYDKDFKLKRLGLTADQRAIGALYIFATEVGSPQYAMLESAVRNYSAVMRVDPPFAQIDRHFSVIDGHRTWTH